MNNQRYSFVARALHWLIAGMIVSQYILAKLAERAEDKEQAVEQLALLAHHKSLGMTIFGLAIVRLLWRFFNRPPALPDSMPDWKLNVSLIMHWLLYGLIVALPLSGWLMSSANAYSVSWFNLFVFTDMVMPDEALAELLYEFHHFLAEALFVIAVIHIVAALQHYFIEKDGVLGRMASAGGWMLFLMVAILNVVLLGRLFTVPVPEQIQTTESWPTESVVLRTTERVNSDLPIWEINYKDSFIRFTGEQAGAPYTGEWQRWEAVIQFDEKRLVDSFFDVTIQTELVSSGDKERDDYIVGSDFFDARNHPEARFIAEKFEENSGDRFTARGILTIKGLSHPVAFDFVISKNANGVQLNRIQLEGKATLDRLAWNIGTGDWVDTAWVGKEVQIEVKIFTVTVEK